MKHYNVIGVYADSAFGGIEILSIDDDTVVFRWNHGTPGKVTRAKIRYTTAGKPYFISGGIRRKFDEIQRI